MMCKCKEVLNYKIRKIVSTLPYSYERVPYIKQHNNYYTTMLMLPSSNVKCIFFIDEILPQIDASCSLCSSKPKLHLRVRSHGRTFVRRYPRTKVRVRLTFKSYSYFLYDAKKNCPNGRSQHIMSVVYEDQCASDLFYGRMNLCAKYSVFIFTFLQDIHYKLFYILIFKK